MAEDATQASGRWSTHIPLNTSTSIHVEIVSVRISSFLVPGRVSCDRHKQLSCDPIARNARDRTVMSATSMIPKDP